MTRASPIWNIPHQRNPFFTGREDVLNSLHNSLKVDQAAALTQPQGISGLGGIGKTQTALEYAYRYQNNYHTILWARADSHQVLVSEFASIANILKLPEKDERDQTRIVTAVKRWLKEHTHWLLILDNVEAPALAREFIPSAYRGHVLLTTRAQAMGILAQHVELEEMQPEVGALLLLRRAAVIELTASIDDASSEDHAIAMQISEIVDGLPLALDQAGAYIKETPCSLSDYLDLYHSHQAELLKQRGRFDLDHPEPVTTTWSLSFEKVMQADPAATELLQFCAFLYPDSIPEEIVTQGAPDLSPILQSVASDPFKLNAAIKELRRFSLLRRESNAKTFTIHRLVQAVLKDRMDTETQGLWVDRAIRAVNRAFPNTEYDSWPHCQRCLPNALISAELIQHWEIRIPEAADLLNRTAGYLLERGQYTEIETLFQQAVTIYEQILGTQHLKTAQCLDNLAKLYWKLDKYADAEALLLRVLQTREQVLGPEHRDAIECLNNLGVLYSHWGKSKESESLLLRTLAVREQVFGPEHIETAESLNNLALLYGKQGRYIEAEQFLRRVLMVYERVAPQHPHRASTLNNLGLNYWRQGKYVEAEPYFQQTLALREQLLGSLHPDTAQILHSLGTLYYNTNQYEQALSHFRRALAIYEQAGIQNHSVADTLSFLGVLFYEMQEYMEAEEHFQRSLTIRKQLSSPQDADIGVALRYLALIYTAQGRYIEAEPLAQSALALLEQTRGPQHPSTIKTRENYLYLLVSLGREDDALKFKP